MNLHVQISWQVQHFVNVHVQISWQAQHFVNLEVQISGQNAISPAFRALDTHAEGCPRQIQTQYRLHFAPWTRTISAEGCVSFCSGGTAPGLKRESEEREVKM